MPKTEHKYTITRPDKTIAYGKHSNKNKALAHAIIATFDKNAALYDSYELDHLADKMTRALGKWEKEYHAIVESVLTKEQ